MSHPLLQRDTSRTGESRFTSTFDGGEFFLRDHRIHGQRILPGAAYIEMARAAVVRALGLDEQASVRLHSLLWARPFSVERPPRELHIGLRRQWDGHILFEVYCEANDAPKGAAARVIHCRGRVESLAGHAAAMPPIEIEAVARHCVGRVEEPGQFYDRFSALGIEYGPGHRGVASLVAGRDTVVARLELPACLQATADQFVAHPAILDAAFQAAQALPGDVAHAAAPAVPFAVREATIAGRSSGSMWAVIRRVVEPAIGAGSSPDAHLNIDVCDDRGVVVVRLVGYATRCLRLPS